MSFTFKKNLKAIFVWNYFAFHAYNPTAESAPFTAMEATISLVVGGHATGEVGVIGVPCPHLKVFTDLQLQELPFVYNETSWALTLTLRVITSIPAGGYFVL